ncbi:MAG: RimK/LysX family protein [Cyanobacteriota bacterium]|nr:RimK/LysX family protein [Cyanobacteriota bacterium]
MQQPLPKKTSKILSIAIISIACLSLGVGCQENSYKRVGWVENVKIANRDSKVSAKLDSGATTSSINAEILSQPDEETESGGTIKFKFIDTDGNETLYERPIERWVKIKRKEGGTIRRPVVKMIFCIAGKEIEEEVNLSQRDEFNYSILVGRNMLEKGKLTIDSSQTFTSEPNCNQEG